MIKDFSKIEQPLGRILSHTGKGFLTIVNTKLRHLDIDRSFYALALIESCDRMMTQNELADVLGSDKVSVVRIIDYLSKKGYIRRERSVSDRRKHFLTLTDKAKKELPVIKSALKEATDILVKNLNPSQVEDFYKTLKIIRDNIKEYNKVL